jgi:putative restriction endonuclease
VRTNRFVAIAEAHARRLQWFLDHQGETVTWPSPLPNGDLLVSKGKAIYKPRGFDYAVSVRVNLGSPYPDGELLEQADKSWAFTYHEEAGGPEYFTNAALLRCRNERIPCGVLRQVGDPGKKPRRYVVLGLGVPIGYRDGYFLIVGASETPTIAHSLEWPDVLMATAEASFAAPPDEAIPPDDYDARVRTLRSVHARKGQAPFRRKLLEAYQGRCAISDCTVESVLEAAHLRPYRGPASNSRGNGLLLRADLHTLFDLGHIGIDPISRRVSISPALRGSEYETFSDRVVREPDSPDWSPVQEALEEAWSYHQTRL